ncbi:MAG: NADH:flavin oxidoreductase [Deltaproteobacteria bacterium]|nr:NADH:flavin oxidoreductase [Deltaproteobacteria bacterium]
MSHLFEESSLNTMRLRNRFVRSATWEGLAADDGSVTPRLIEMMTGLAEGGVGLIIPGHAYVEKQGQAGPWQLGAYDDRLILGLKQMTDSVHKKGSRIALQLAHSGYFARREITGHDPIAPSSLEGIGKTPRKAMTKHDIERVVKAFGDAAGRAKEAGFDAVQIHAAHGYLLSQFLSPFYNRREDEYGGSVENRARVVLEVLSSIRQAVGPDFPVLIKMNCADFIDRGLTLEGSIEIGKLLERNGIDAIELSGGVLTGGKLSPSRMGINTEEKEAYFRNEAKAFKKIINVPLILVGGIRSFQVADKLLKENVADYFSMSRPLIREPNLVNRGKSGDLRRAECVSDNQCFIPGIEGKGVYCLKAEKEGR